MYLLDDHIPVFGEHQENTLAQLRDVAERAECSALMADGHLGYIMPVGGVAAYDNKVSVAGVGFDIACGNAAIKTDLSAEAIYPHRAALADELFRTLSFGVGRHNECEDAPTDDPLFEDPRFEAISDRHSRDRLRAMGRKQIGTIGSGNHYVDVFADETGTVWVGVHFGSRGMGWNFAMGFMALAQGKPFATRVREEEALLPLDSPLGHDYWQAMNLAGDYAYLGREWVARKAVSILGGKEVELVHNHHNFAWIEVHDGRRLIVVRKGATPAWPGQRGFVGGSMGDCAVIIEGTEHEMPTLYSTVHGAGRVMSRTEARGKVKKGRVVRPGKVSQEMMDEWLADWDVVLRGGDLDESPHAYRRLPEVLEAQGETITVLHTLWPMIVCMAGANEFDPYKD